MRISSLWYPGQYLLVHTAPREREKPSTVQEGEGTCRDTRISSSFMNSFNTSYRRPGTQP